MTPLTHPRAESYPQHRDYEGLGISFCPYLMYVHRPGYRSRAVNTDAFGLREQYDAKGQYLDLRTARSRYPRCSVVVGGSTVFGVDASSDRTTLASRLTAASDDAHPWINLGIRGATSQQELLLFQHFKRLMPAVDHVVILSGVNTVSMAAVEPVIVYPDFGGLFSLEYLIDVLYANKKAGTLRTLEGMQEPQTLRSRVAALLDPELRTRARSLLQKTSGRKIEATREEVFQERLSQILELFGNELDTWRSLAVGLGFRVSYVLQPCIGWTSKPLTALERACFEADLEINPGMRAYASTRVYEEYRGRVRELCSRHSIPFFDANEWFSEPSYANLDLFTDVCHLTDRGNELLASLLRKHLSMPAAQAVRVGPRP